MLNKLMKESQIIKGKRKKISLGTIRATKWMKKTIIGYS